MNYQRIYDAIINRASGRKKINRESPNYVYYERHHIIPKCLGGNNEKSNLVFLTAEEHWLAHLLLVKLNPGNKKLVWACQAMSMVGGNTDRTTNKLYGWIRREYSAAVSASKKGKPMAEEQKLKLSRALLGRPAPHQKGENNVAKRPEVAKKISVGNKGQKRIWKNPEERNKKISMGLKGHRGAIGDANPASRRISCIFCRKETALPNLSRDHKKCPK